MSDKSSNSSETHKSYLDIAKENALHDCVMLYEDLHKPMSETCMCWGWECSKGWNHVLSDLSYELEALNITYGKKHMCHIRADQLKQKFGTLHFYYSVVRDIPFVFRVLSMPFGKLSTLINRNVKFKTKEVTIHPAFYEDEVEELTDEQYEQEKVRNFTNVECCEFEGKQWRVTHLHNCAITKRVPTHHKILWCVMKVCDWLTRTLDFSHLCHFSREDDVIAEYLDTAAERAIRRAEDACYNVCEECGKTIGVDYSPRCQTRGWITYICENCAKKSSRQYYMGNDKTVFCDGKQVSQS